MKSSVLSILLFFTVSLWAQDDKLLTRRSPIAQPYEYVSGGAMTGAAVSDSPDPMVSYVWDSPKASDPLQVYVVRPVSAEIVEGSSRAFQGYASVGRETCSLRVRGQGILRIDFGVELPAWIEIDSPDLCGDVLFGVSEYNVFEHVGKVAAPKKYGRTYRLELNSELYEGVRYAFIYVRGFQKEFNITSVRAVCQVKPANYTGSFDCDNPLVNKIWYTGAYDVRANQRADCFGAILKDRGDRFSWTGDAYPAQAASLVAFSNYDEVLKNLHWTECHPNGIETYELYWVESLLDYYMYSGDEKGFRELLPKALSRISHAWQIFDSPRNLEYIGWDQRLGTGFDNPNCQEGQWTFRMLAIGAAKHLAKVLRMIGEGAQAAALESAVRNRTESVLQRVRAGALGMHASGDAINADLTDDLNALYHPDFSDRERRLSYSPFNQCFLLKAMAHAGHYDDAFASVLDQWGGQIEYGGTCFFEVFRPDWVNHIGKNGAVPFTQAGFTSLAHPWGAGVVQWLSEEMLGIKPTEGGFRSFIVKPHFSGIATRVKGHTNTPYGPVNASFDLKEGRHSLTVPAGTTAQMYIPKEGMRITSVRLNGQSVSTYAEEDGFLLFADLKEGTYDVQVQYQGTPTQMREEEYYYPVKVKEIDTQTHGEWFKRYGKDGYFMVCGAENGKDDLAKLPPYVESVGVNGGENLNVNDVHTSGIKPLDPSAMLPVSAEPGARKVFGCYYSYGCCQRVPLEVRLKERHPYQLAVYLADCDKGGRDYIIEVFDLETMNRISPCVRVQDMKSGVYVVYDLDCSVSIMASNIHGDNTLFNAVFFDSSDPTALVQPEGQQPEGQTAYSLAGTPLPPHKAEHGRSPLGIGIADGRKTIIH